MKNGSRKYVRGTVMGSPVVSVRGPNNSRPFAAA